jgi:hypothetical protein
MCYRGYGAGKLASAVLDGGDRAFGYELQSIVTTALDTKQKSRQLRPRATDPELQQWGRRVKPVTTFDQANHTKGTLTSLPQTSSSPPLPAG